ncbi:MAG: PucC family protein, partial [Pseudomonadota bacterium]
LTATIRGATRDRVGLAIGAWGAVQATAAGIGIALAGILRDVTLLAHAGDGDAATSPYLFVFGLDIVFLTAAALTLLPAVVVSMRQTANEPKNYRQPNPVEAS